MSTTLFSLAFGVGTQNRQGAWLEVFYAQPLLNPSAELVAAIAPILGYSEGNQAITFTTAQASQLAEAVKGVDAAQAALLTRLAESHKPLVATLLAEDAQLTSTPEAYLKLHLLSHRLVKPHGLNLAGDLPAAAERGLDQPGRDRPERTGRAATRSPSARRAAGSVLGGQVPENDRLRGTGRRAYR